jgi:hypothetical protein
MFTEKICLPGNTSKWAPKVGVGFFLTTLYKNFPFFFRCNMFLFLTGHKTRDYVICRSTSRKFAILKQNALNLYVRSVCAKCTSAFTQTLARVSAQALNIARKTKQTTEGALMTEYHR